jgi:hypothetical protein
MHDTGNGHLHEEDSFCAEGTKYVHLWAVTNMYQVDTWIFVAPDPAVVGIDLTNDKKRLITSPNHTPLDFFLWGFVNYNYPR